MEGVVDAPVELVQIHCVEAILEMPVLCLAAVDRLFMLAPLIGVARLERRPHPLQNLLVEVELVEQRCECLVEHLLPNIFAAAIGIAARPLSPGVEPVVQNRMNGADRHRIAARSSGISAHRHGPLSPAP